MRTRLIFLSLVLVLGVFTSGCVSIEQEVFLQADGSGDLVLHISLPDFPESMKASPMGGPPPTDEMMQKFKSEVMAKLPPTITLKDAKELKRNGTLGFYAVFGFKNFKDIETLMAQVMQESAKDAQTGASKPSDWKLKVEKQGNLTQVTQLFYADLSESKVETSGNVEVKLKSAEPEPKPVPQPAAKRRTTRQGAGAKAKPAQKPEMIADENGKEAEPPPGIPGMGGDFGKELAPLLYSAIKFRFVLHTPTPIRANNADIVLNGNTALWNCSLAAFAKENKPIEMKVSY